MLKIINPATDQLVRELQPDCPDSIQIKYQKAKLAQIKWAQTPLQKRMNVIKNFKDLLIERQETLAALLTQEMGKPITQSRSELTGTLARIDFFLEKTSQTIADEVVLQKPEQKLEERISHEPLGVITNISAWNYPYFVGGNVFIPALLTGNAVLYKPSEFVCLTGLAIQDLLHSALHSAGCSIDVFATVIGGGTIGSELLKLPIQGVFFTGSYATGQRIAEACSRKMIRTQLELGGKDPVYVCNDVQVKTAAASLADGSFYNAGQGCCSVERLYVHEEIYDSFVQAFVENVQSFKVGNPMDEQTYIGPLTRRVHLDHLLGQVTDAVSKGAKVACGGKKISGQGNYFEPTVLTQVNHSMEVMREESFGPIIGIQKVKNDHEALELINDTAYGLTAGVYTQDQNRARQLLSQVNTGTVYWNCCDRVSPNLPWSGRGHSGIGTTLSSYGIQTFLQLKAWHLKTG